MSKRVVDLVIPKGEGSGAAEWLGEHSPDVWVTTLDDERTRITLVVDTNDTERVLDKLDSRYGHIVGFRAVVMAVDVSVPDEGDSSELGEDHQAQESRASSAFGRTVSRQQLLITMKRETRVSALYVLTVCLSVVVAGVGLINDNVAVLIAAMIIAPLLGANIALALATTTGDGLLAKRALTVNATGVGLVTVLSMAMGAVAPVEWLYCSEEIMNRTTATLSDFLLASAAGSAGTLAFTTGLPGTLIGVMVAVALMPPLLVVGLMLGKLQLSLALGAFLLLAANVICLNLASVVTFLAQGVRPNLWWKEQQAKRATRRSLAVWTTLLLLLGVIVYRLSTTPGAVEPVLACAR